MNGTYPNLFGQPATVALWGIVSTLLLALSYSPSWATELSTPKLSGLMSSSATGTVFMVQWQGANGGPFRAWLRLGDQAGDFKLVEFDTKAETLRVEDRLGRHHQLRLPEAKVHPQHLAESEFGQLLAYTMAGANTSHVHVLRRQKAIAFYLDRTRNSSD